MISFVKMNQFNESQEYESNLNQRSYNIFSHEQKSTQWTHPLTGKKKRVVGDLPFGELT